MPELPSSSHPSSLDTRLQHIDCLHKLGWLTVDVRTMGNPDGYIFSPCCEHGYRVVWGPRTQISHVDYDPNTPLNQIISKFDESGSDGNWVLVTGASVSTDERGDPQVINAKAKWWVTSQTDSTTPEEELVGGSGWAAEGSNFGDTRQRLGGYGEGWMGLSTRWDETLTGVQRWGLRRWTKQHENAGYDKVDRYQGDQVSAGGGYSVYVQGGKYGATEYPRAAEGIAYGLGERSGIPRLDQTVREHFGGGNITPPTGKSFWVKYGDRAFLGVTQCTDSGADPRHLFGHGSGANWNGFGKSDMDLGGIVQPGRTTEGGMHPSVMLIDGDIQGAYCEAILNASGDVTGFNLLNPGATVIEDPNNEHWRAPVVKLNTQNPFYSNFKAIATVSDDPDVIKNSVWGNLFLSEAAVLKHIQGGGLDPLAQTFTVPSVGKHGQGYFIHSIDLCFAEAPGWNDVHDGIWCEIRPCLPSGVPHPNRVLTEKQLLPIEDLSPNDYKPAVRIAGGWPKDSIGLHEDPVSANEEATPDSITVIPDFNDPASFTRFQFDYPVFVRPGNKYAIVVRSQSTAYKLWIADHRQTAVVSGDSLPKYDDQGYEMGTTTGTYNRDVAGSLYRSTDGKTWQEDLQADMMYRINKCKFVGDTPGATASPTSPVKGTINYEVGVDLPADFNYDQLQLTMLSKRIPGGEEGGTQITGDFYAQRKSETPDELTLLTGTTDDIFNKNQEIVGTQVFSERMVLLKDKAEGKASFKGSFTFTTENADLSPTLNNAECYITPIQNKISSGGLRKEDIRVGDNQGSGYTDPTHFMVTGGGSTKPAYFAVESNSGKLQKDTGMKMITSISDSTEVTFSGEGFHKSKDEDDPIVVTKYASHSGSGATFDITSEEGTEGGNALFRYETMPVSLARGMEGRGLRIYLTAHQPYGSMLYVYEKHVAVESSERLEDQSWTLVKQISPDPDHFDERQSTFSLKDEYIEYEYATPDATTYTTTTGETYDTFNRFAVKIVGHAQNEATPPTVRDFRAIAVY